MRLHLLPGRYAVARLDPGQTLPSWPSGAFVSITRTSGELSIICDEAVVPRDVRAERGWRCMSVEGPIPFEVTGVAASITTPLAAARISVFLIATYDTDYLLVKEEHLERARQALRRAEHDVADESPA
jgi:hypothetical protein